MLCHHGDVGKENFLLFLTTERFVLEYYGCAKRRIVGELVLLCMFWCALWRAHLILFKMQFKLLVRIVGNWRKFFKYIFEAVLDEPLERFTLRLDEIRKIYFRSAILFEVFLRKRLRC